MKKQAKSKTSRERKASGPNRAGRTRSASGSNRAARTDAKTSKDAKAPNRTVRMTVRDLTPDDWSVIERLFGENGACGGCWCMTWRVPRGGKLWEEQKGEKNKRAFKRLLTAGKVFGCLAFAGDEPVGWCCVGPRGDFPRLERTKALQTEWGERTWSVTCFYIKSAWRGRGIASKLLPKAVALARRNGAREVEGYPVRSKTWDKIPAAFAWTGVPPIFESCGFKNVSPPDNPRDIYTIQVGK